MKLAQVLNEWRSSLKPHCGYPLGPKGPQILRGAQVAVVHNPKSHYCFHRCAAGASNIRFKSWNNIRENACCIVNRRAGSRNIETSPVGLKLAVFGIFNIVIFVYITVERKPLFG